ncbi:MAG: DUF3465 domain-containing protein [Wenzhouxiangellaceae bacterium]|nr:DUF3465 domain-containing protein [Wenzhouxiangellaceae bacterium]
MRRFAFIAVVLALAWWLQSGEPGLDVLAPNTNPATGAEQIERAFAERVGDLQVRGRGRVVRVLPPDNDGRPHQRFILELDGGHTVLVAHNLTLADPVEDLRRGDEVEFFGEYEWNPRGGVIHWTHHDPAGRHADGWLRHRGRMYQ